MPPDVVEAYEAALTDKTGRMQVRVAEITNMFINRTEDGKLVTNPDAAKMIETHTRSQKVKFGMHSAGGIF